MKAGYPNSEQKNQNTSSINGKYMHKKYRNMRKMNKKSAKRVIMYTKTR